MSLYLKYRPKKIKELDLASVRETLGRIIESSNLSHAYLFTGPRGSGKTSAARIIAKLVNCVGNGGKLGEPCGKCDSCKSIEGGAVDIVEIDAASNRGIDDIRELKQRIGLAPSHLKKKVYIIDEVHMLTTEAFNALLKTLEEPPNHTLFILCTTEAHKVPETIVSRCTRVVFSKASESEIVRSLKRVISGEKGKVSDEAIKYIAGRVDGSFRDAVKILDQLLSSGKKVEVGDVEKVMYGSVNFDLKSFVRSIIDKDPGKSLEIYRKAREHGVDYKYMLVETMSTIRVSLLAKYGIGVSELEIHRESEAIDLVYMIDDTIRRGGMSQMPDVIVELMIIKWCGEGKDAGADRGGSQLKQFEEQESNGEGKDIKVEVKALQVKDGAPVMERGELEEFWRKVLKQAEKSSYSLEALLSKSWPRSVEGDELVVEVTYEFHRQQLMTDRFRAIIEGMVKDVFSYPLRCRFELGDRVSDLSADDLRSIGESGNISKESSPDEMEEVMEVAKDIFIN